MILAPNRQPLSSGSKILALLFIVWAIMFSSCASTTPTRSRSTVITDRNKEKRTDKSTKVLSKDTTAVAVPKEDVAVDDEDRIERPSDDDPFGVVEKDKYRLLLLLPIRDNIGDDKLDANNTKFIEFYNGLKIALTELDDQYDVQLAVIETNRDTNDINRIIERLQNSDQMPDLIIGPYETEGLSKLAEFGRQNRIPIISPWKASSNVTANNLFFLQLRPNISTYYEFMVSHAVKHFDRENIRIITHEDGSDLGKARFLQKLNRELSPLEHTQKIEIYPVAEDSLSDSEATVFVRPLTEGVKAFIMPHFNAAADEDFVYDCLRKLNAERNEQDIYVYTMPLVLNSTQIDLNIFKNIKVRVCEFKFADMRQFEIQRFNNAYFQRTGHIAGSDAYWGYDVMNFVLRGWAKYGKYFHYYMQKEKVPLSHSTIQVGRYVDPKGKFRYLENKHLYTIEYLDHYFQASSLE